MLMRCGIGPAGALREERITVRADMPGVGANVQPSLTIHRIST
jgi:hypothetical protein